MRGAAAEAAGARIPNAVDRLSIIFADVFAVPPLPGVVAVMADEIVPAHRVVFSRAGVEDWDTVYVRKPVGVGISGVAALQLEGIPSGFQNENLLAVLGKSRGDCAAPCARADDDIVETLAIGGAHESIHLSVRNEASSAKPSSR